MSGSVASPRVAVVGLGTMGSMALWQLASRGARATGFEQFGVAHDFGAAGGGTRMFRMVYAEGSHYADLLRRARTLWHILEDCCRFQILVQTGCLTIAGQDSPQISRSLAMAQKCDLPYELLDRDTVEALFPEHRLLDREAAVLDPYGGVLRTDHAVRTAVDVATSLGAEVHEHAVVEAIDPHDDGVRIVVAGREQHFDRAVVCTGPWMNDVLRRLGFALDTRRVRVSFHLARNPRMTTPGRCVAALRQLPDGRSFGLMSSLDGSTVKVVSQHSEADRSVPVDDVLKESISRRFLGEVTELVSDALPHLHPYPVRVGAHPEGFTPDGEGLVGTVPAAPNVVLLSGFSGHGFKLAPAFGEVAAELALTGASSGALPALTPERFADGARPDGDSELSRLWFDVGNAGDVDLASQRSTDPL